MYNARFYCSDNHVADMSLEVTNTGQYVNQAKIDRVNLNQEQSKHVYSGVPDTLGTFKCLATSALP